MKKTKIIYWIFTVLLIALMLMSAVTSFMPNPQGEAMMKTIGYPYDVLYLLSVAKILGIIALLVPGFSRLKEWAYAGFTFDLIGATYAFIMVGTPIADLVFMLAGLVFVFGSYISHHKLLREKRA
ncbi:DoxX family protein [Paradesertivirga mongoliensis]|uniref:DoxX family protein n=1 Tax=Paradesertivirga mongoliensis TaxID=2100740 RepID=A0ABW4ZNI9_9SPHI|nr:DoxX family protein [Pedobacter mongoliensis]